MSGASGRVLDKVHVMVSQTLSSHVGPQQVAVGPEGLPGEWFRTGRGQGLVVFAHGSGSSRLSPRNRRVADVLHGYRIDTLLFDLLTQAEAEDRANVFDITLLCERLRQAVAWVREASGALQVGLFGASTGAAAALYVAALEPAAVAAVVSRGGRPDLAGPALGRVLAPTLLIVGGLDAEVLQLNREALRRLPGAKRLEVVPGATHLFAEAGALETVAHLAGSWFETHLRHGGAA